MLKILINNTEYTANILLPIKWSTLLDERLDEAVISVHSTSVRLFPIGSTVNIQISADSSAAPLVLDFIVSADQSTQIPPGSGRYDHELTLIEPTKMLEGTVMETLTFTNGLGRIYPAKFTNIAVNTQYFDWNGEVTSLPIATGIQPVVTVVSAITNQKEPFLSTETFTFPSWDALFANRGYYISHGSVYIQSPDGKYIKSIFKQFDPPRPGARNTSIDPTPLTVDLLPGKYTAQYEIAIKERNTDEASWTSNEYYQTTVSFDFDVITAVPELPKWNIANVITRVLNLAEPHLVGAAAKYILDTSQSAEFEKIQAPEFAFTNMTLKEILDQIGGFIHGIPRLVRGVSGKFDTIHYDMLGGTEKAALADPQYPYVTEILTHNIENYATELDSTAENLVNTLDRGEGAITEPIAGGFRTVRSEEAYARITDGNMIINTTEGIYSVHKLEVIDPNGKIGDITPFVFEGTDYGRLSSYQGDYPTSKSFALYYELGKPNIKGLNFKTPSIYPATVDYAITNIIKAVTGADIGSSWWNDAVVSGVTQSGKYPTLKFRITYTPIFSARILQHKPYIEPNTLKRALAYNQSTNLIETRYYGENLKGAIARIGNAEIIRTYHLAMTEQGVSLIPQAGQLWNDDYYVSAVTCALFADCIECTVSLSKDFNRLSQYIGINSEWRAYEVSEKNAYRRSHVYADYMIIGDAVNNASNNSSCITSSAAEAVKHCFVGASSDNTVTGALIATHAADGVDRYVCLPVISTAFGNSIVFSTRFSDNFSAGVKSEYGSNGKTSGYWQTDVEYCDFWGRFESMRIDFGTRAQSGTSTEAFALDVPQVGGGFALENSYVKANLDIQKDNREVLQCNYVLQFVSNWKDLIIGEALMRNNEMVNASPIAAASLYVLKNPIGKFDNKVSANNTRVKIGEITSNDFVNLTAGQGFSINRKTAIESGKAWAILDDDGNIYLARNIDIAFNDKIDLPTFSFVHELP